MTRRSGSLIVALLWCVALLSVLVVGALHSAHMNLRLVKNHGDAIQAQYLALAGIEKAKAMLYRDMTERKRGAQSHSGALDDAPDLLREVKLGRGQFSVVRQGRRDEGGGVKYGIIDEESRLNVNHATAEELGKLYGMTPEVAAAIIDWRDGDNNVTNGGAEVDYYASLPNPYMPRNGRFQTIRELLMVRGVTRDLFMGEDINQNGLLDPEEDDGRESTPADNHDGVLDAGWSGDITVESWTGNKSANGEDRVNVQSADEKALSAVPGITTDIAKAIVAYRGQKQIENLMDLLDVTAPNPNAPRSITSNPQGTAPGQSSVSLNAQPSGPKVISQELLMDIADDITTLSGTEQPGPININSASVDVLSCLPGVTPEIAQAIVSYRKSAGFLPNIAHLLKVNGITTEILRRISSRICARSETFRILSEGKVPSTGARKRIQAVVRLNSSSFQTLSWREDL